MKIKVCMVIAGPAIATILGWHNVSAQTLNDNELVRLLSSNETRESVVDQIAATGRAKVPLLLSWAHKSPTELFESESPAPILEHELNVGLADVFGRLRTVEAIPFLIRNISIERLVPGNTWSKAPEVIEADLPAAGALVRIGAEASKALIEACERPMPHTDRVIAIFVVSQIKGVPEAKPFLSTAKWEAATALRFAAQGLKSLDNSQPLAK